MWNSVSQYGRNATIIICTPFLGDRTGQLGSGYNIDGRWHIKEVELQICTRHDSRYKMDGLRFYLCEKVISLYDLVHWDWIEYWPMNGCRVEQVELHCSRIAHKTWQQLALIAQRIGHLGDQMVALLMHLWQQVDHGLGNGLGLDNETSSTLSSSNLLKTKQTLVMIQQYFCQRTSCHHLSPSA